MLISGNPASCAHTILLSQYPSKMRKIVTLPLLCRYWAFKVEGPEKYEHINGKYCPVYERRYVSAVWHAVKDIYIDRQIGTTFQGREHAQHPAMCLSDAQSPGGAEAGQLTARLLRMCSWTSRIWDSRRSMSRCSRT
jgi:hypothetical protein